MLVRYRAGSSILAVLVALGLIAVLVAVRRAPAGPGQAGIPGTTIPLTSAGVPTEIGGQRVLVGLDVDIATAKARDASSFLIGVWVRAIVQNCAGSSNQDPAELAPRCGSRIAALPGFGQFAYVYAAGVVPDQAQGPMVLRAHSRDARAADCRPENRIACEHTIVAESVVWTSAERIPSPITQELAIERLSGLRVGEEKVAGDMTFTVLRELLAVASGPCASPSAQDTFVLFGDVRFGLMAIFQDSAARDGVQRSLDASHAAAACLPDAPSRATVGSWSWVAVDNVLVLVAGATANLKAQLESALSGQSTTAGPLLAPPDKAMDESLSVALAFESARRSGQLNAAFDITDGSVGPADFFASAVNASGAADFDFAVAASPLSIAPSKAWPDGAKTFTVDHPGRTVGERITVFRSDSSHRSDWQLSLASN